MSDRDRSGWIAGTWPQDLRIHRFAELLAEQVEPITPGDLSELCAAIWRRIEEEERGEEAVTREMFERLFETRR